MGNSGASQLVEGEGRSSTAPSHCQRPSSPCASSVESPCPERMRAPTASRHLTGHRPPITRWKNCRRGATATSSAETARRQARRELHHLHPPERTPDRGDPTATSRQWRRPDRRPPPAAGRQESRPPPGGVAVPWCVGARTWTCRPDRYTARANAMPSSMAEDDPCGGDQTGGDRQHPAPIELGGGSPFRPPSQYPIARSVRISDGHQLSTVKAVRAQPAAAGVSSPTGDLAPHPGAKLNAMGQERRIRTANPKGAAT